LKDLGIDEGIIGPLKWIVKNLAVVGLELSGKKAAPVTFFHECDNESSVFKKREGTYWPAERLLASSELWDSYV
jgi:hypothetical protein